MSKNIVRFSTFFDCDHVPFTFMGVPSSAEDRQVTKAGHPKQYLTYTHSRKQLFRERLLEKVHATIPKGIVGGFKFTVL